MKSKFLCPPHSQCFLLLSSDTAKPQGSSWDILKQIPEASLPASILSVLSAATWPSFSKEVENRASGMGLGKLEPICEVQFPRKLQAQSLRQPCPLWSVFLSLFLLFWRVAPGTQGFPFPICCLPRFIGKATILLSDLVKKPHKTLFLKDLPLLNQYMTVSKVSLAQNG